MSSKIYTSIVNFIKENGKYILFMILLYLVLTVKVPYSIESPGGVIKAEDRLSNIKYKSEGSFNLTYVSFLKGTIPTVLLSFIMPEWDLIKDEEVTLDGENIEESFKRDQISLKSSISSAKYIAYKEANVDLEVENVENLVIYIDSGAETDLRIGDDIRKYDGVEFSELTDFKEYINTLDYGSEIKFDVLCDGEEKERTAIVRNVEDKKQIGVMITKIFDYNDKKMVGYSSKSSEAGASGGLMITLAIYNSLIEEDITRGMKICGTGTIESDGTVGEISGIKYKLSGAVKKKCDVFIAPTANFEEASEYKKKYDYDIKLIEGVNFSSVLEKLKSL